MHFNEEHFERYTWMFSWAFLSKTCNDSFTNYIVHFVHNCVLRVLSRKIFKPHIFVSVYAFKQKELQQKVCGRTFSYCMLLPPSNLFLHYVLIWSQIVSRRFFCEVSRQEKWEFPSQKERNVTAADFSRHHGNSTLKILSLMRTAGKERLIT